MVLTQDLPDVPRLPRRAAGGASLQRDDVEGLSLAEDVHAVGHAALQRLARVQEETAALAAVA